MSGPAPQARRRWPRWRHLAAALVVTIVAWLGGFVWFAQSAVVYRAPPDTATDAIVVLTGGRERVATGLELLEAGAAPRLFISGVHQEVTVADLLELNPGISPSAAAAVTLGRLATTTAGNAVETADWVADEGIASIRLVTSAYHMPRALSQFRRYLDGLAIVPHPVDSDRVRMDEWWSWPGTASLLFSEYNKYLAVQVVVLAEAIF
ncbi:MAG: YdcF family protein [Azospirillaceae bacterium]